MPGLMPGLMSGLPGAMPMTMAAAMTAAAMTAAMTSMASAPAGTAQRASGGHAANTKFQRQHPPRSAPAAPAKEAAGNGRARKGSCITEEELKRLCKEANIKYVPPPNGHNETDDERSKRIRKMKNSRREARRKKSGKGVDRTESNKKKKVTKMERFLREKMHLRNEEVQSILPAMVKRMLEVENGPVTVGKMHHVATKLLSAYCLEERGAGIVEDNAGDSFASVPDDDCDDDFGSTPEESEAPAAASTADATPDQPDGGPADDGGTSSQRRYQLRKRKAPSSASSPATASSKRAKAIEAVAEAVADRLGMEFTGEGYVFEKYCKKVGRWVSCKVVDVRQNQRGEYLKCECEDGCVESMTLDELVYWHNAASAYKNDPFAKRRRTLPSDQVHDYHLYMYFQHVKGGHSLYCSNSDKHSGHLPPRDAPFIVDEMTVMPEFPYVYNAKLLSRLPHGSELVSKFKEVKASLKKNNILSVEVDKSQAVGGMVRVKPFDFVINYKQSKLMNTIKQKAPKVEDDLIRYLIGAAKRGKLKKDLQRQDLEYQVNTNEDLQERVLCGFGRNQEDGRADYLEYKKIPIPNLNVKAFLDLPRALRKKLYVIFSESAKMVKEEFPDAFNDEGRKSIFAKLMREKLECDKKDPDFPWEYVDILVTCDTKLSRHMDYKNDHRKGYEHCCVYSYVRTVKGVVYKVSIIMTTRATVGSAMETIREKHNV